MINNKIWKQSFSNELGRLVQGVGKIVKGVDTILFIKYDNILGELCIYITYVRIVVDYRPQKDELDHT